MVCDMFPAVSPVSPPPPPPPPWGIIPIDNSRNTHFAVFPHARVFLRSKYYFSGLMCSVGNDLMCVTVSLYLSVYIYLFLSLSPSLPPSLSLSWQASSSVYVSSETHELLNRISGRGLAAQYRYTRRTHLYSESMVDIEVTFTNSSDAELNDIAITNKVSPTSFL